MSRRLGGASIIALALVAAVFVGGPTDPANAARMCPPVTLDDLFPPTTRPRSSPAPTTTTPADSSPTSTTAPTETTQPAPETTVTTQAAPETTVATPTPEETTVTSAEGPDPAPNPTADPTPAPAPAPRCEPFRYSMTWPLAGDGQVISVFGTDRDQGARRHKGVDIAAPTLTPVVAVADGVVMKVVQEVGSEECCWTSIRHHDGWQSYYLHLNNDLFGTDDGLGVGVRPDLVEGMEVAAGEVIGWLGDSGNAEETVPHLHFELRTSGGVAIDAVPSVRAARNRADLLYPQPNWPYSDDDDIETEWLAARLISEGLFLPCGDMMTAFCPDGLASPDFASAIVSHYTGRPPPPIEGRYLTLPNSLSADLQRARMFDLVSGCTPDEDCVDYGVPETELARIAAWARIDSMVRTLLPESAATAGAPPTINLPSAVDAELRLRTEGAIQACNPALDDQRLVDREEALTLLVGWVRGLNPEPCFEEPQRTR